MDRSHHMSSRQNYMLNLNTFNAIHKLGSSPIGYEGFVQPRLVAKAKQNEIRITIILSVTRICICISILYVYVYLYLYLI